MTTFEVEVFQNQYLPIGGTKADAIVSVTAQGSPGTGSDAQARAEVIVVDASGSMGVDLRMHSALAATKAAIDVLADDTWFAVVAGTSSARSVYPTTGELVPATAAHRDAAKAAVDRLIPNGGTCFSEWLAHTERLLRPWAAARRHVILLTDGINEERAGRLTKVLASCKGRFECDCRGIGADWKVDELRRIATELLGTVDIIPEPSRMEEALRSVMQRSMATHARDVALEVWTPAGARIRFVKQVLPSVEDLSGRRVAVDERRGRYPLGSWGDETRSYHVWVDVPAHEPGDELLAARVQVVVGDEVAGGGKVLAVWTDEAELSTRLNPVVAHYTGQAEMAAAIDRGVDALQAGDRARAEAELGRAARLAAEAGNDDTLRALAGVAEHLDPATGTLRLRPKVDALAERVLEAESTKTVTLRRQP